MLSLNTNSMQKTRVLLCWLFLCLFSSNVHRVSAETETVTVQDPKNPVTSYTKETIKLNGVPIDRTLSLTATIRRTHIKELGSVAEERTEKHSTLAVRNHLDRLRTKEGNPFEAKTVEDYHNGRIIPWRLGGPSDQQYNFYPQGSPFNNEGTWKKTESLIWDHIHQTHEPITINYFFKYANPDWPGIPTSIRFKVTSRTYKDHGFEDQSP